MVNYASIPTVYNGVRFRSRLEARWAATFDQLGWSWDYEPVDLRGWIPDFILRIPSLSKPCLVEVKPLIQEMDRARHAATQKIESALGAPPDYATRAPLNQPYDAAAWTRFFENAPYEYILLGNGPLRFEESEFVLASGLRLPSSRWLGMGWRLQDGYGWVEERWCPEHLLLDAWHAAQNKTQWRAPA